ncbi:MAG TPA: right-handed parallel beta-helix repeat-containing protein [Pirellulaceae bacterium]|jgi:parallel beta-helix repeat protein
MSKSRTISRRISRRNTFRPLVEQMEDRRLLATAQVDDSFAADDPAHHKFTTIQAAVTAAKAGDTIKVAPGTYNESVTVDKKLTIVGSQGNPLDALKHPTIKNATIVEITGGQDGFHLAANDIVIRGFTIEDSDMSQATSVGVEIDRATSGDTVDSNLIQETTEGMYLNTSGAHKTTVQNNLFRNNNNPGAASGNGIYSDQGASNVVIQHNYFTGQTNASIIFVDTGASAATNKSNLIVKNNTMDHDSALIFTNGAGIHVVNNSISNSSGSGVFFGGGVTNSEVSNNKLTNGAFTGVNLVTNAFGNAPTANSNIQIVNNKISGFGDAGIRVRDGATHVTVKNNDVRQNGTLGGGLGGITLEGTGTSMNQVLNNHVEANKEAGILLISSSGNTVSHNDAKKNGGDGISLQGATGNMMAQNNLDSNGADGIHANSVSTGNTFNQNTANKNATFDYQDDSHGAGTAGTANTWTKNKGKTASPSGLISK